MSICNIHSQAYYDEECPEEGCVCWDKEEGICKWIVTMNTRNIQDIRSRCEEHGIFILPISEHITAEYVQTPDIVRSVFGNFIDAFCTLITHEAPERPYPYLNVEQYGQNRTDRVIQDLLMGVSYGVIEHRYNVSRGYISRIASYIRSFNIPLSDRRKKDWRDVWELQE